MKCEICNEKDAAVRIKQVCNGEAKEMFVCEGCAAKSGFDPQLPLSLTDFLFGAGMEDNFDVSGKKKTCLGCGMSQEDFQKKTRLGCPDCYDTFKVELEPYLDSMHKGAKHVGKVPQSEETSKVIASLDKALKKAIADQNFEDAAELRDKIQELGVKMPAGKKK